MATDPGIRARSQVQTKVFWSAMEKSRVIARAIAIQSERPDMSGLPLLREAMQALPSSRRRKVMALSQAAWFEVDMRAEVRRQAIEKLALADDLTNSAANVRRLSEAHEEWRSEQVEWKDEQIGMLTRILEVMQAAVDRLDEISAKLGSPVPIYAQPQPQPQPQNKARERRHAN